MGTEDHSKENNYEKAIGLLATVPTAIGFFYRRRKGLEPIMPGRSCYLFLHYLKKLIGFIPASIFNYPLKWFI